MEHRIVSLIASATEIVSALGFQDSLVGRSHECDFPPEVENLTVCSEPRIDVTGTSLEIDQAVRRTVRDALSVYSVFRHELERLQPTHIITQTQCDVCAVSLRDVEAAVCGMVVSRPAIVSLEPMCLANIWSDIERVAESLDATESGQSLIQSLQFRLDDVKKRVPQATQRPRVFCLEWLEPIMSAGNWVPELVEIAGGKPILCEAGKHSPYVTWDDLLEADPDVIAIMPCGFDMERTKQELHLLTDDLHWSQLRAVQNRRVYLTDGNQFFNRPGPRVVESAEILFEVLHGESTWGHCGNSWAEFPGLHP
ncbi:ABC transporter substrate-binding protein [bacterium]|nr:ABC transporter substrate-binding protein [bacterium]